MNMCTINVSSQNKEPPPCLYPDIPYSDKKRAAIWKEIELGGPDDPSLDKAKIINLLDKIYEEEHRSRQWNEKQQEATFAMWQSGICYATMGFKGLILSGDFDK